jgi:hypothetical protein
MKSRLVLAALLSTVMLAPAAFAGSASSGVSAKGSIQVASMTPTEQCTALQGQWQKDAMTHKSDAKYAQAEKLFGQGQQLCQTHKEKEGTAKLEQALKTIGLKPQV